MAFLITGLDFDKNNSAMNFSAMRANADANGNVIHETYLTQEDFGTWTDTTTSVFSGTSRSAQNVDSYLSRSIAASCLANGEASVAEGYGSIADGYASHAEGGITKATGGRSHAEGSETNAKGYASHAEGELTTVALTADYSHAEGKLTTCNGRAAHAEGGYTIANNDYEHAEGLYNISHTTTNVFGSSANTLHSIGIGSGIYADNASIDLLANGEISIDTVTAHSKNAFEVMQNGDIYMYGAGGYDGHNLSGQTVQSILNASPTTDNLKEVSAKLNTDITSVSSYITNNESTWAKDTTYSAGDNITISDDNKISIDADLYKAITAMSAVLLNCPTEGNHVLAINNGKLEWIDASIS